MLVYKFSFQLSYLQNYGVTKYSNHYLFLEILLIVCNVLIFNIYCVSEMEKETKWKQQNQETPK